MGLEAKVVEEAAEQAAGREAKPVGKVLGKDNNLPVPWLGCDLIARSSRDHALRRCSLRRERRCPMSLTQTSEPTHEHFWVTIARHGERMGATMVLQRTYALRSACRAELQRWQAYRCRRTEKEEEEEVAAGRGEACLCLGSLPSPSFKPHGGVGCGTSAQSHRSTPYSSPEIKSSGIRHCLA